MRERAPKLCGIILISLFLIIGSISCQNNQTESDQTESNSPTLIVEKYIQAYLGGDIDGIFETMSPLETVELKEAYGEDYKNVISQELMLPSSPMQAYDMTFQEIPLVTQSDKTLVLVTDGKVKYMGSDGNWVYPSSWFRYKNSYFETVNIDGFWYVENLFEVGDMRIILSEELTNDELDEISAFLAAIPGVDKNSIDFMTRHQVYEDYIKTYPDMEKETTEESFRGRIDFKVTDPKEVLPAKTKILEGMPYREAVEKLNTFSVSAVSARK
jgi:hypothetical protein